MATKKRSIKKIAAVGLATSVVAPMTAIPATADASSPTENPNADKFCGTTVPEEPSDAPTQNDIDEHNKRVDNKDVAIAVAAIEQAQQENTVASARTEYEAVENEGDPNNTDEPALIEALDRAITEEKHARQQAENQAAAEAEEHRRRLALAEVTLTERQRVNVEAEKNKIQAEEVHSAAENAFNNALQPEDYSGEEKPTVETLNQRIVELESEIGRLDTSLNEKNQEKTQLEEELVTARARLADAQVQEERALQQYEAARQEVERLEEEAHQATEELTAAEEAANNPSGGASGEFDENSEEYRQLSERLQVAETRVHVATYQLNAAQANLEKFRAEKEKTLQKQEVRQAEYDKEQAHLNELEKRFADLSREVENQENALAEANATLISHRQELDRINGEIRAVDTAVPNVKFTSEELYKPTERIMDTGLYREENGYRLRVVELREQPTDLENLIVRARTDSGAVMDYRVTSVSEVSGITGQVFRFEGTMLNNAAPHGATLTHHVDVMKKQSAEANVYTTFASLLEALRAGHNNVSLGRDVYADEIAPDDMATYVNSYSGTFNGHGNAIHGLAKPLFASLGAGRVSDLKMKDARVLSEADTVGVLAARADGTTVSNVHVSGEVQGRGTVGALFGTAANANLTSVSMTGLVRSTSTDPGVRVGGLAGYVNGGKLIRVAFQGNVVSLGSKRDAQVTRVGGLVGHMEGGATLTNAYAGGNVLQARPDAQVGGLVGSLRSGSNSHGRIQNAVSAMNVPHGMHVHGDKELISARTVGISVWQSEALQGESQEAPGRVTYQTDEDAEMHYGSLLTPDVRADDSSARPLPQDVADERRLAFENYRKLLPFGDLQALARAVNALPDDDALMSKKLLGVMPTVGGRVTSDAATNLRYIDGLILHFADGTVQRRALRHSSTITEGTRGQYLLMSGGLPYTPDHLITVEAAKVSQVVDQLRAVEFANVTLPAASGTVEETKRRGKLYLERMFDAQKEKLDEQVKLLISRELTSTRGSIGVDAIVRKIVDKKNQFLLGLAYINKWYDIDFDGVNLRDLALFHRGFYGDEASPVDLLIELGSRDDLLNPARNVETFRHLMFHTVQIATVHDTLDHLRQQFTRFATFNDWFKKTSKAYIVEAPSAERPDQSVLVVDRLKRDGRFHNMFLPLLTVSEGSVWVITHMSSIAFGAFERYFTPKAGASEAELRRGRENVKKKIDLAARKYREYFDMWYRVGNERMRNNLLANIPVWDGFAGTNWSLEYGPTAFASVEEFYGPVGRWYPANGLGGYSNRSGTWMVGDSMLVPGRGVAIYTHEMTHNMSYRIMLGGYGERPNSDPELYPTGLLQNPYNRNHDTFGFNQADYYDLQEGNNLHNQHPDRFTSMADIDHYFKEYFQALYLLDNLEADTILVRSNEDKARLLMRLLNHDRHRQRDGVVLDEITGQYNGYAALTADEVQNMNLTSIQDLVHNELLLHRGRQPGNFPRSYVVESVMNPLYGTAESNHGMPGENVFKRNSFELWAARGFENGWVPYTSDKYNAEARRQGINNLPDTFIMPKIFGEGSYATLKDYRKHAYAENRERAQRTLKPITVNFNGKREIFTTYDQLAARFVELMDADLASGNHNNTGKSKVYAFKRILFNALMEQTREFRSSIFTDGDVNLPQSNQPPTAEIVNEHFAAPTVAHGHLELSDGRYDSVIMTNPAHVASLLSERATAEEAARSSADDVEARAAAKRFAEQSKAVADGNADVLRKRVAKINADLQKLQSALTKLEDQINAEETKRSTSETSLASATAARDEARRAMERYRNGGAANNKEDLEALRARVQAATERLNEARARQQQLGEDRARDRVSRDQARSAVDQRVEAVRTVTEAVERLSAQAATVSAALDHVRAVVPLRAHVDSSLMVLQRAAEALRVAAQAVTDQDDVVAAAHRDVEAAEASLVEANARRVAFVNVTVGSALSRPESVADAADVEAARVRLVASRVEHRAHNEAYQRRLKAAEQRLREAEAALAVATEHLNMLRSERELLVSARDAAIASRAEAIRAQTVHWCVMNDRHMRLEGAQHVAGYSLVTELPIFEITEENIARWNAEHPPADPASEKSGTESGSESEPETPAEPEVPVQPQPEHPEAPSDMNKPEVIFPLWRFIDLPKSQAYGEQDETAQDTRQNPSNLPHGSFNGRSEDSADSQHLETRALPTLAHTGITHSWVVLIGALVGTGIMLRRVNKKTLHDKTP